MISRIIVLHSEHLSLSVHIRGFNRSALDYIHYHQRGQKELELVRLPYEPQIQNSYSLPKKFACTFQQLEPINCRTLIGTNCRSGNLMVQVTEEVWQTSCNYRLLKRMAEHTGQSSQLFPVTTGRNAEFLARGQQRFRMASESTCRTITARNPFGSPLICKDV